MRDVQVVIKAGGAALTHKDQLETLNSGVLEATAAQIAQVLRAFGDGEGAVLVHGAGSFGHKQASAASVHRGGIQESSDVRVGFARTRASVTLLNNLVVQALLKAGVPAVGVSPFGTWTTDSRQVVADGCGALHAVLEAGLLPVLHGDAVLDRHLGCTILGGDALVSRLCEAFRPRCAVFLTNVPGIFSRPPGQPGAELLSRIEVCPGGSKGGGGWVATCHGSGRVLSSADVETSTSSHDTTGGIEAKIAEAAQIATEFGVEVRIAEAGTPHALAACLPGPLPEGWVGTVVAAART